MIFRNSTPENDSMSERMSAIWANFARNGVPSADGLEEWEPYDREHGATMLLDNASYLTHKHDEKLMNLLVPKLRLVISKARRKPE